MFTSPELIVREEKWQDYLNSANFYEVSLSFILRLFAPFHASLRHVQTCQLQKQTDPAKTGLVRYLVSKSHGSETCNCRVQRVFSLSRGSRSRLRRSQSQLRYEKKKPSGTQGRQIQNYLSAVWLLLFLRSDVTTAAWIDGNAVIPNSSRLSHWVSKIASSLWKSMHRARSSGLKCFIEEITELLDGYHFARFASTKSGHHFVRFFSLGRSSLHKTVWHEAEYLL